MWKLLVSAVAVIGIGFLAVWSIISNVTASLLITIWAYFHLGQIVETLPKNRKVALSIANMMFTMLRDEDGSIKCFVSAMAASGRSSSTSRLRAAQGSGMGEVAELGR